jgi:hypothetical protein
MNVKKFKHVFIGVLIAATFATVLRAQMGDKVAYPGTGNTAHNDVYRVDGNGGVHTWDQSIRVGDKAVGQFQTNGALPSTSSYYGYQIPFFNSSGATLNAGDIVLAKASGTSTAYGTKSAVLSTTTVMGINVTSLASNATGFIMIAGYAVVNTTGTVSIGDMIVTTDTVSGYGGKKTSPNAGEIVGIAVSVGTASGGSTLVKLR